MTIGDVQSSSMNIDTYGPCEAVTRTNKDKVYKRSEIEQWSFGGPEQTLSPGSHKTLSKLTLQCADMFQTPRSTTTVQWTVEFQTHVITNSQRTLLFQCVHMQPLWWLCGDMPASL